MPDSADRSAGPDGRVVNAAVRMQDVPAARNGAPDMTRLVKGIGDKARLCRPARPPVGDARGKDGDHQGHADETRPGRDMGMSETHNLVAAEALNWRLPRSGGPGLPCPRMSRGPAVLE